MTSPARASCCICPWAVRSPSGRSALRASAAASASGAAVSASAIPASQVSRERSALSLSPTLPLPLAGLAVLNLRAAEDAPALTQALAALGARVIEWPVIAFAAPQSWAPFDERFARLEAGDWIAFTSATALRFTLLRLGQLGQDRHALGQARFAAIGRGTARALAEAGLPVHLTPPQQFQAEGLRDALLAALRPGEPVWLPRAEQGREALVEGLAQAGHRVCVTPVYRTLPAQAGLGPVAELLERGAVDWIVFTSAAMVTHFVALLPPGGRAWLSRARIACLGRVTAQAAEQEGLRVAVVPARQDLAGLVEALAEAATAARAPLAGKPAGAP